MSIFDQAYDNMEWEEICYRLPGDLAVKALKRRITNLDTLDMFFSFVRDKSNGVKEIRDHVNATLNNFSVDEIFDHFEQPRHALLFSWTNADNKTRLKDGGGDALTHKFLFNLAAHDDFESLHKVLDHVLAQPAINHGELLSVLNKVNNENFIPLFNKVINDPRPEAKIMALCVRDPANYKLISRHQRVMGLKALAKINYFDRHFEIVDFSIFSELRPLDRLNTLYSYLSKFPLYKQLRVFNPSPSEDEVSIVLFAGCIEHYELVQKIEKMYADITVTEPPTTEEEE